MRLEELKLKPFAKLAALGALSVCVGCVGLYLLVAVGSRPTQLGGIDQTQAVLTWIALAVPFALIIGAHLVYARVLFDYGRES